MNSLVLDLGVFSSDGTGQHTIAATLGKEEIHRDRICLDKSEDRRRFINELGSKLPAIDSDVDGLADELEAKMIALATDVPPELRWDEPTPLRTSKMPMFPVDALPPVLAKWVAEESEATQTPPDMAALLTLAVCAAVLSKRVEIEAWSGWRQPCNLYVAAILDPANRKSAVFADATKPLRDVESELIVSKADQVAEDASLHRQAEKRLSKLERVAAESKKREERDQASIEARELAKELEAWQKEEAPRLIVDDATSEKLAMLLQDNGERIACMSAEGGVFDLMAGKYAKSATDFNIYLMGHSGDSSTIERVMRAPVKLESPALTLAFAIQPEVIRGIAGTAAFRGRGLLGRFIYAMPESWIGHRKIDPNPMSAHTADAYSEMICSLAKMDIGDGEGPHRIQLSADAIDEFKSFSQWIESELGSGSLEQMKDWGGKLVGATLRIAAIIHCVRHGRELAVHHDVHVTTIQAAQQIGKWAIPHASNALDLLAATKNEVLEDAECLLRSIRDKSITGSTFTRREAQRCGQKRFNGQPHRLDAALSLLEETNHIAQLDRPKTGGTEIYAISPLIRGKTQKRDSQKHGDNDNNQSEKPSLNGSLSPLSPLSQETENERERVII